MASKQIEILLRERNSFAAHEQRIIAGQFYFVLSYHSCYERKQIFITPSLFILIHVERDEILVNIRSHISALDVEIERLGGGQRETLSEPGNLGIDLGEAVIPSVSAFPPVKKPRGRPAAGGDNSTKKKRGRPRKSDSESSSNKIVPSEESIVSKKSLPKSPAANSDVSGDAMSPLTSIAASLISMKAGSIGIPSAAVSDDTTNAEPGIDASLTATVAEDNTNAEPEDWNCECGLIIEGTKSRCGTCRRWKGGKRAKKWTLKDKEAKSSSKPKKTRKSKTAPKTAKSIYDQLSATDLALSLQNCNADGNGDIRSEVENVIGNMITAIANATKKNRKRSSTTSDPEKKRKRGRPAKKTVEKQEKEAGVEVQPKVTEAHQDDVKLEESKMNKTDDQEDKLEQPNMTEARSESNVKDAPLAFESLCFVANYMNA